MIAIPALGGVFVAIFALVFLLAWAQWGGLIVNTLSVNLPVIGNVIGKYVSEILETTYLLLLRWFDSYLAPLANLIFRPVIAVESTLSQIRDMGRSTWAAFITVKQVVIPATLNLATRYASDLSGYVLGQAVNLTAGLRVELWQSIADARAFATGLFANAQALVNIAIADGISYGNYVFAQAVGLVNSLEARMVASIEGVAANAITYTNNLYHSAIAYADGVAARAANDTLHALGQAESYADHAAAIATGLLVTDLNNELAFAVDAIWTDIDAGIGAVEGVLGNDLPDIMAGVRAIPRALPGDIAGTIATSLALSIPMLKFMEKCGIPNCKNLSALGRDLQELLGLVEGAGFLLFLEELAHNPETASNAVESAFGDLLNVGMSAARSVLRV